MVFVSVALIHIDADTPSHSAGLNAWLKGTLSAVVEGGLLAQILQERWTESPSLTFTTADTFLVCCTSCLARFLSLSFPFLLFSSPPRRLKLALATAAFVSLLLLFIIIIIFTAAVIPAFRPFRLSVVVSQNAALHFRTHSLAIATEATA